MKQAIIVTIAAIWFNATVAVANTAAEYRTLTVEMADGNLVTFKMTPEEIQAEDAQTARREMLKRAKANVASKWVETVELPDGGAALEFAMSAEEVRLAKKAAAEEAARKQALQKDKSNNDTGTQTIVVEMADGHTVTFVTGKKSMPGESETEVAASFKWPFFQYP